MVARLHPGNAQQATDKLRNALTAMKKAHPGQDALFHTACATLLKYLGNIVAAPDEEKFRWGRHHDRGDRNREYGDGNKEEIGEYQDAGDGGS